ncbi:TetR/AcrR family transcriptional regulator [Polynucleobacter sp. JS-Fieb-80-E5]|uniref:TetR/AcrR family transcriptional regulator n=1 Tax=Polynucleobacter sp. JS-Fieb-80-E5 TaxID=2081050 RepID=UPI001C0D547D|nr:TetR/AcrR family transcriptional regulator [Polynucleobacter sp. JS-Fieb-80-E5]MBU3618565.1 TetR/AcrR family transcriptional regulator [Polynucleobacter sp. JS-Fieb-80-E5]
MPKVVHHLFKSDEKHLEQIEESLLLSASDLAKEGSIEHIEIEDILNKAQVSRSTFYKIFNSADGLFKALGQKLTNEMVAYALSHSPEIPNPAIRVVIKTKQALLFAAKAPFLASLALKTEWPSSDPNHVMYKDIEKDFIEGKTQGYFSDMPPSIGTNMIIGCLRGAVKDLLESKQSDDYADKVVYQILISLGVDSKTAAALSKSSVSAFPVPPKGMASNIASLQNHTKTD